MFSSYQFADSDERIKRIVWEKGIPIEGLDQATLRLDACGHLIRYADHGNMKSMLGWHIDHIVPRARGGQTTWDNLQPLYWGNNLAKGDS